MSRTIYRERILVVDDHPFSANIIRDLLNRGGYPCVDITGDPAGILKILTQRGYSLILLDSHLGEVSGLDILTTVTLKFPNTPVVFMVDHDQLDEGVAAVKQGAFDVISKPVNPDLLTLTTYKALDHYFERKARHQASQEPSVNANHGLIGRSAAMQQILGLIEKIHDSCVNVLITGPSGTGKEVVAQSVHKSSPRAHKKLVAVNCSAIPDTLLEGELFGYKKGAFTDARNDKKGLFEEAEGGTLFLDEIGDMPLAVQPKILRAIQEKEIRPLGGLEPVRVDVRIIAATNQNLEELMAKKLFRSDLFYRLNAFQLELPPLAARREDIPLLAEHFLGRFQKIHGHQVKEFSPQAMKLLLNYPWPGNVRELENSIERGVLMAKGGLLEASDLFFQQPFEVSSALTEIKDKPRKLEEMERDYILRVLQISGGNRSATAHKLGIGRKTLYNKLARYGMM